MESWSRLSAPEVCQKLGVDPARGLSLPEVRARLARVKHPPEARGPSVLLLFVRQFQSAVVLLLLLATIIAILLGEHLNAIAIAGALVLNALVGFLTEYQASTSLAALRKLTVLRARTLRNGQEEQIPSPELVPGDIVLLTGGDRVPADGRLLEAQRLLIDESILTGESQPVEKHTAPLPDGLPLAEQKNLLFGGTTVLDGTGRLVITATGVDSELGRIGKLLEGAPEVTPLEQKLDQLGNHLLWLVAGLAVLIIGMGLLRGTPLGLMLETGIAMAIAAIPEGLPVVATLALAVGMKRMANRKVLIRRLAAVESLGAVTVIAADKTGTLTANAMTVRKVCTLEKTYPFSGEGYDPHQGTVAIDPLLCTCLQIGVLDNDAALEYGEEGWHIHGDPSEASLLVAAGKAGIDRTALQKERPRVSEIPFESRRKRMTVVCTYEGGLWAYSKGAPEVILPTCLEVLRENGPEPLTPSLRERLLEEGLALSEQGMRVLALAYKPMREGEDPESGLIFAGLVGMQDPPKAGVKEAIQVCHRAGIRTVMITGDHPVTARAIAQQLRLTGERPIRLSTDAGAPADVYARISPEDKLRIVQALKGEGDIVAMTGDGVNDAPALKAADVGIAMGSGADVAKEAAAMILVDNHFESIVEAVREGRIIDGNIRKSAVFLFTCSLSMLGVISGAILLDLGLPLLPLQILWLNLLIHVFPAIGLALEPGINHELEQPPRPPSEPILSRQALLQLAAGSLIVVSLSLALLAWGDHFQRPVQSLVLMFIALMLVVHSFVMQSERAILPHPTPALLGSALVVLLLQGMAIFLPPFQAVLQTHPLAPEDGGMLLLGLGLGALLDEAIKPWIFPRPRA